MSYVWSSVPLLLAVIAYYFYRPAEAKASGHLPRMRNERTSPSPNVHIIDDSQLAHIIAAEPHHLLFRLQSSGANGREDGPIHPRLGITLQELEKCLPWIPGETKVVIEIPGETKVVIESGEGFDPALLEKLRTFHVKRDLFLVGHHS